MVLSFPRLCIFFGLACLVVGLELQVVDSFVLSTGATRALATWTGPVAPSASNNFRQMMMDVSAYRSVISPPAWISWALLSAGGVLTAHGLLQR